jgi:hypothetical protein
MQLDKNDETKNHGKKRESRAKNDNSSSEDSNERKRASMSSLSRIDPKKAAFMHRHGLDLSSSESDDDKTMLKEMQARQESVAVNNIHNNSTLSAGRIRARQSRRILMELAGSQPPQISHFFSDPM